MPGTTIADLGKSPGQYNPFGMAFAPDGTLYFIDIHVACKGLLTGCGPAGYGGRVMKVTVTNGQPATPVAIAGGFDFPTSVTVCVPATTVCPYPSGAIVAPLSGPAENPAPDTGPTVQRSGHGWLRVTTLAATMRSTTRARRRSHGGRCGSARWSCAHVLSSCGASTPAGHRGVGLDHLGRLGVVDGARAASLDPGPVGLAHLRP